MKKTLGVILLATAGFSANALANVVMHSPTTGSNYVAYQDLKTATDADAFCKSKQGHLAVINTHAEVLELQEFLVLLLQNGPVTDQDSYYLLGSSIAANSIVRKNVTGQGFYQDPNYYYDGFDGATTSAAIRYLQFSSFYLSFRWADLSALTSKYICEFEDAPI